MDPASWRTPQRHVPYTGNSTARFLFTFSHLLMLRIHQIVASCLPMHDDTALASLITRSLQTARDYRDYRVDPHSSRTSARGPTYVNPYSRGPYYAADDFRSSYVHCVPTVPYHLQDKTGCVHLFRGLLMTDLCESRFYCFVSAV